MSEHKHEPHAFKHPHLSDRDIAAKVKARDERAREGHHKARHGHEHLHARPKLPHPAPEYAHAHHVASYDRIKHATLSEMWAEFWAEAKADGSGDPPGPARDQLIHHYGMHGFLEERYAREQAQKPKP